MKVIKEENNFGTDIILKENDKYIRFSFGGNLDLYWSIYTPNSNSESKQFIITKENYGIYSLFEKLFDDIENINIFDNLENIDDEPKDKEKEKKKYRSFNLSNYNELFNENTRTITWYSDETAHEVANILTIKQEKNIFKIDFSMQPHIKGYDEDFHNAYCIPIRFRNSGSSYDPFNYIFMRMYNNMKEVDDIHDIGHQIHLEEYLYEKKLVKKATN